MFDDTLFEEFLLHWQTINRHLRKGVFSEGLGQMTRLQWMLLRYIHKSPLCTMGQLAERFGVKPSTISQMMDRLERDQLVVRSPGTTDARQKIVQLSDKGQALMYDMEAIWSKRLKAGLAQFTKEEQEQFIVLLSRLANSIQMDATSTQER